MRLLQKRPVLFCACALALAARASGDGDPGERYLRAAEQKGVPPLHKKVYQELAKLHRAKLVGIIQSDIGPALPAFKLLNTSDYPSPDNALIVLYGMGFDILPVLAEALDDTTPTRAPLFDRHHFRGEHRTKFFNVNAVVAMLVCAIAQRDFAIGAEDEGWDTIGQCVSQRPEYVPLFKRRVLEWYAENAKKPRAERMVEQVSDPFPDNRLTAIHWIGYAKEKSGRDAIRKRVGTILRGPTVLDIRQTELAVCALALGQVGDPSDLDVVRRVCKYFSGEVQTDGPREGGFSKYRYDVFAAYHGLALLGKKDEAIKDLQRLYDECSRWMDDHQAASFRHELDEAKKWGGEGSRRPKGPAK